MYKLLENRYICRSLKEKGYSIEYIKIDPKEKNCDWFDTIKDRSIDLVCINPHGSPTSITLSNNVYLFTRWVSQNYFVQCLAKKLAKKASVILFSCATGGDDEETQKENGNIAKEISASLPNVSVYAPIHTVTSFELNKEKEGIEPLFFDKRTKIPYRTYLNQIELKTT